MIKTLCRSLKRKALLALVSLGTFATCSASLYAAEGEQVEFQPLAWQTDLAVWTAVVFGLLLVVLWVFAFGPIVKALDQREKRELERFAAAEKASSDAQETLELYRRKLAESGEEARRMIADATADAERTAAALIDDAKKVAAAERARAIKDVQAASDVALREIASKSADLATTLAGKIIRESLDSDSARRARLTERAVGEIVETNRASSDSPSRDA